MNNLNKPPINIHFDMETGDPDDACTLLMLIGHPAYSLVSVSVTPGTNGQIGLVRHILTATGHSMVPIGAAKPGYEKQCVSHFHNKWLGNYAESEPDGLGHEIVRQSVAKYPDLTILTGGPLKNFRDWDTEMPIHKWVAQGGFAGDNLVAPEHRLEKFAGKTTCATYNFNGDVPGVQKMLTEAQIDTRYLVSKNVCHGMYYDADFHAEVAKVKDVHPAYELLHKGMGLYLDKKPEGKKFHDPLAAAVAAAPEICTFAEVEMYRTKGEWGANPKPGSRTWISISADREAFIRFFTAIA